MLLRSQPGMGSWLDSAVGAVTSVGKDVGKLAVTISTAPVKYSTEAALMVGGQVLSQLKPVIGQAANVASGAIQELGQVGAQVGGAAAGAAQGILTSAGQAVSAAKGNTYAPPPPSNLPLYIGGAAAVAILGFALLRQPAPRAA
jgi:hypothetical protein